MRVGKGGGGWELGVGSWELIVKGYFGPILSFKLGVGDLCSEFAGLKSRGF